MISFIRIIANGIDDLIRNGIITTRTKVVVYGLDRYSFAIRTILSHRNIGVSAFLSDDMNEVLRTRRNIKDFACRYFNSERDAISIVSVEEIETEKALFEEDFVILIASDKHISIKNTLNELGFKENADYYIVYDFYDKEIDGEIEGKQRLTLQDIQNCGRQMLKIIDEFCIAKNLRYWASGGTMLGAVRHNGFIPWDDDVDLFMPLKDYLEFLEEFPQNDRYIFKGYGPWGCGEFHDIFVRLIDRETVMDHNMKIVREISGIWLDIFPLVGLPSDEAERKLYFRKYQELEKSILQDFYETDGDLGVFKKRFPEQEAFLTRYDFDRSEYVGVLGTQYGEKDNTSRHVYDDTIRMKFDDGQVNVPIGYREYLTALYGDDWMEIPRTGERISLHTINAYKAR